jgi:hypothetical protein
MTQPARNPKPSRSTGRRGSAALMAMVFLTLFATLAVAMASMSTMNAQSAGNLAAVERARAVAESGLRWQSYRFRNMTRPKTLIGNIDSAAAATLWPEIKTAIRNDYAVNQLVAERAAPADNGTSILCPEIALDAARTERFRITIAQDPLDNRNLIVTSTGRVGNTTRSVSMTFTIDKKVKFAVVGKVPIQIGRNTIVEGNVAMAAANKFPPILMLSDFLHFDPALKTKVDAWNAHLKGSTVVNGVTVQNHNGYDNRVSVNNPIEYQLATARGYTDFNTDGYIDEYDLWVRQYDNNGDKAVSKSEFTNPSTGKLYDDNLFAAMDSTGAPFFAGDVTRLGYRDGVISNADAYAKVRGTLSIAATEAAWAANLATSNLKINDMIQGTVAVTTPTDVAVKFGATQADLFDLDPVNFESCANGFRNRTGAAGGSASRSSALIQNTTLARTDANATAVTERTPLGSTSYQATFARPVFRNMTFRNVIIPKGLNALFDNCTFEGVTFVETERDILKSTGMVSTAPGDGMSWAQRKVAGDNFSKDKVLLGTGQTPATGQTTTQGSQKGNNLRFNDCTFKGPLAGNYATAYTHFANSWEFTGKTLFDNQVDQTATIVSPQVNIEMGSFTDPSQAPSKLIGVVVAGNIDIRGYSDVDGSIIITGDGAGNTTLAYFGASDGDTNPTAMPEGGYGKLNIRYNPYRALPDGINIPIDILPRTGSYREASSN